MKKIILLLAVITSFAFANLDTDSLLQKTKSNFFIQNKGQWPKEVKYLAKIGGMNAWITDLGIVYDYYKIKRNYSNEKLLQMLEHDKEDYKREHTTISRHIVKTTFLGKSINTTYRGEDKKQTYYNYFIGKNESKWASYVPLYGEVRVNEIYNGIDIRYYYDENLLRYDFIVKPGADISQINMALEGANNYTVNKNGELEIEISLGLVKHQDIIAYQKSVAGKNEIVKILFTQKDNGSIGFRTGGYDKEKELIIDPLVYSTFIGGSNDDRGEGIALDVSGNVYVTGYTSSTDFPTTTGAIDESFNGNVDVFITKLNTSGSSLVYSTFIGGSNIDEGKQIAMDNSGNVIITGYTLSADYPTTSGAFDESFNGNEDVFITKLNTSGSVLVYSTFIGGSDRDFEPGIAIDNSGNVYVTGYTLSVNYPTTSGAYDENFNGNEDIFITKLNISGSALVYSTFIGGSDRDFESGITIDNSGNVYVTGWTHSTDYPTTTGAYDESFNGSTDAIVTKLNASGSGLVYSSFIGGSNADFGFGIALDNSENAYVTGKTNSTDFPTTTGAFDESFNGGIDDAFVAKLNVEGSSLIYSSFIGGSDMDRAAGIVTDISGNVFVIGLTGSTNYPTTTGAFDESRNGSSDVFITKLNAIGNVLVYSTFLGGNSSDFAKGIALDNSGNVFITGGTNSTDYPTTAGAFDESFNGGDENVFITKLEALVVGIVDEIKIPNDYRLFQNYPNPFNPTTTISYSIPNGTFVTLKIFDILGREAITLVNEEKPAGTYTINFNAEGLSSGVYFYKMQAGRFVQTKKLVFMK